MPSQGRKVEVEIAAAARAAAPLEGYRAIPAEARLLHYGIGPDPYSDALRTLQWFGLVEVISVDRRPQSRSYGEGPRLHRLKLTPSAFEDEASSLMIRDLQRQLKRRSN